MDAKVHPARQVHCRDAEERFALVHLDLRRTKAVESVGLVADLDVAVLRHRHNYRELFLVRARDCHP